MLLFVLLFYIIKLLVVLVVVVIVVAVAVVVVVVVRQTVGSISIKTLAYDCFYTLALCTASMIATSLLGLSRA